MYAADSIDLDRRIAMLSSHPEVRTSIKHEKYTKSISQLKELSITRTFAQTAT
jgi:hypothetical protein